MTKQELPLPPLPDPHLDVMRPGTKWYTADQMREYAHAALAQSAASGEPTTVSDLLRRSRNLLSHPPRWWQENEASRVRLIGQLDAALHATVSEEPNMRHPKIQALIGSNARRNIELQLVEQLLDDPDCELTSMEMEYWYGLHDKLRDRLLAAAQK